MDNTISFLGNSQIALVDVLGNDKMIVNCARTSFAAEDWASEECTPGDERLIQYLASHKHVSPFYQPHLVFSVKCTISTHRQFVTHRVGVSINSESSRYTEMREEFYVPEVFRAQSKSNKQGSEGAVEEQNTAWAIYKTACLQSFFNYHQLLKMGVAKELAREVLPLCTLMTFTTTMSLAAVAHFIKLRTAPGAQEEIRQLALALQQLGERNFPISLPALLQN